ncbi:fructose-2,6-bisphosphatase TIGAR B [Chanos chanos]|uniref:fructose-2,6-bisphosphate 2-phosphatase n=1 Tax=Chanos chanos TaxID=29144 RepID=A0A6J2WFH5_CHACN|nr:fructose-2,6-bisphosphatase TIGAR [Chanos chanos]
MITFGLTIVRHGETPYNKDKLLQGQGIDCPLSATGLQQAEAAGQYLRDLHFTKAFVSDLQRAKQTAEIILRNNIHSSSLELVSDPLLRERGFGIAEGRPKDDLKNMANAAGQAFRDFTPPGGETMEQVKTRFRKFFKALLQQMVDDHDSAGQSLAPGPVPGSGASEVDHPPDGLPTDGILGICAHALVVSHGAYIRVAVRHFVEDLQCSLPQGLKMSQVFSACPNTGICRFIITLSKTENGPVPTNVRCIFINRKDHLSSVKETD